MKKIVQVNVRKMSQRKIVKVRKMCHNQENGSQLEKCVTVRKICHTLKMSYIKKNGSHLGTRVTDRRICHFKKWLWLWLEKWAIEKFVTGRKMCCIWKNGSVLNPNPNPQLEKCVTLKKRVTIRRMCHSENNVSQ